MPRAAARIRALLRLAAAGRGGDLLHLGDLQVDLRARAARRHNTDIGLTPREFDLLAFLLEHPGQVFGKTQLLAHVWGPDADVDTHAVTARMSALRARVEPNPNRPRYLLTRPGVGYYLQLDPATVDEPGPAGRRIGTSAPEFSTGAPAPAAPTTARHR